MRHKTQGSHTPLEDRKACISGAERGYLRIGEYPVYKQTAGTGGFLFACGGEKSAFGCTQSKYTLPCFHRKNAKEFNL
jgi:hypothetical protein